MRTVTFKPFGRGNIFGIKDIFPFVAVEAATADVYIFSYKNKNTVYEKESGIVGRYT